jgi:hypothetical protein
MTITDAPSCDSKGPLVLFEDVPLKSVMRSATDRSLVIECGALGTEDRVARHVPSLVAAN